MTGSEEEFKINKENLMNEYGKAKPDEEKIKHLMKETLQYRRKECKDKYQTRIMKSICDEYPMFQKFKYVS